MAGGGLETTHRGERCSFPYESESGKVHHIPAKLTPHLASCCLGVRIVRALASRDSQLCRCPSCMPSVRRRSRPLGVPFSRKHLKNAGRQRSSRFGYLLPLVLLRNSLADYTALISTTLALCPGLGKAPRRHRHPRRGGASVGKTHLERRISTRFKNTPRATFS